jgi:hypothetical protein
MSVDQPTLEEFIRHAERFGAECAYETAAEGYLDAEELGILSLSLQRLDRHWRLKPAQRIVLAKALIAARLPLNQICEMAQISRTTLFRLRTESAEVAEPAKSAPETAQPCAADVSDRTSSTVDTDPAEMKHRARPGRRQRAPKRRARTRAESHRR